jgi:hypothetical protein
MARHIWSVLCTKASIESQTNVLNMFGVIEELQIEHSAELPAGVVVVVIPYSMDFVSFWVRSSAEVQETPTMQVSILSPAGERRAGAKGAVPLVDNTRARTIVSLPGFPVGVRERGGIYTFLVEVQDREGGPWTEVARVPVEVKLARVALPQGPKPALPG